MDVGRMNELMDQSKENAIERSCWSSEERVSFLQGVSVVR